MKYMPRKAEKPRHTSITERTLIIGIVAVSMNGHDCVEIEFLDT